MLVQQLDLLIVSTRIVSLFLLHSYQSSSKGEILVYGAGKKGWSKGMFKLTRAPNIGVFHENAKTVRVVRSSCYWEVQSSGVFFNKFFSLPAHSILMKFCPYKQNLVANILKFKMLPHINSAHVQMVLCSKKVWSLGIRP